MKSVKNFILSLGLFAFATTASFAQTQAPEASSEQKEQMAQAMETFVEALNLTDEQKIEFKAISSKYNEQMMAVRDSDMSNMKKYREVKAIRSARNAEMEELLTEEQYEIYLEKQEEIQQQMKERRNQNK
ncbi:MAG: hypothetical protein AAFP77_26175 [Bacteroidota bacterium]